jgi:hypothetical protein
MSLELAVRRQTGHRQGLRRGRYPVTAAVHAVWRSDLVSESELLLSELDRQLMMEQFRANSGLRHSIFPEFSVRWPPVCI